jgi:hypothetical protein
MVILLDFAIVLDVRTRNVLPVVVPAWQTPRPHVNKADSHPIRATSKLWERLTSTAVVDEEVEREVVVLLAEPVGPRATALTTLELGATNAVPVYPASMDEGGRCSLSGTKFYGISTSIFASLHRMFFIFFLRNTLRCTFFWVAQGKE